MLCGKVGKRLQFQSFERNPTFLPCGNTAMINKERAFRTRRDPSLQGISFATSVYFGSHAGYEKVPYTFEHVGNRKTAGFKSRSGHNEIAETGKSKRCLMNIKSATEISKTKSAAVCPTYVPQQRRYNVNLRGACITIEHDLH